MEKLTRLVLSAEHIVVMTGAGVSTSAGIPDFRGPRGIWTIEERGKRRKKTRNNPVKPGHGCKGDHGQSLSENDKPIGDALGSQLFRKPSQSNSMEKTATVSPKRNRDDDLPSPSFEFASPTFTHRAITTLASRGLVKFCITQNVDGLHRKSGLPRSKQSVLHGCIFTEKCNICQMEYFRDFDVGGVSFKKTGRKCTKVPGCAGDLHDTILDWEDPLPEDDWEKAQLHCKQADLVLALGTSLRIEPAGSLPLSAKRFVIVNLQATPYDNDADLIIRAKVDDIMTLLMKSIG